MNYVEPTKEERHSVAALQLLQSDFVTRSERGGGEGWMTCGSVVTSTYYKWKLYIMQAMCGMVP